MDTSVVVLPPVSLLRAGDDDQQEGGKDEEKCAEHGGKERAGGAGDVFMEYSRMSFHRRLSNGPDAPSVRIRWMQDVRADD